MKMPALLRTLSALAASALLLAACGGGGGGGSSSPPSSPFGTSQQFSEPVAGCEVDTQRKFVRAYLDEVYFWYSEIVNVDPGQFTRVDQIDDYFNALLLHDRDRFSAALFTGKHATVQQSAAPGVQLSVGDLLATHAVPAAPTITTTAGGRRVGYIALRNHDQGAQDEMIAAVQQLQSQGGVNDLVLDLRDNLGGFVYVALSSASMITGPANDGRVFERLVFNNKRGESSLQFSGSVQFSDGSAPQFPVGTPLPRLNLQRVFVLTGGLKNADGSINTTCSASESIINSLRGVGVQVIRLGETTCGKPYGFSEKVNCGWSFFAIEFQGFNAAGFGDYQNGFQPMCQMASQQPFTVRGTASDPLFMGALFSADNTPMNSNSVACPPASTFTGVQSSAVPIVSASPPRSVTGARWLLPSQMPH